MFARYAAPDEIARIARPFHSTCTILPAGAVAGTGRAGRHAGGRADDALCSTATDRHRRLCTDHRSVWRIAFTTFSLAIPDRDPAVHCDGHRARGYFCHSVYLNHEAAAQARAYGAIVLLGNAGAALGTPLFVPFPGAGLAGLAGLAAALCAFGIGALWFIHRKIAP